MEFLPFFQILVKSILSLYILFLTFRFVFKTEEVPVNENNYQFNQGQNTEVRINREVNLKAQNYSSPLSRFFDSVIIIALDVAIFNYIWINPSF